MPSYTLSAYSKAYPFITNRIRASIALESSPLAIVAQIIDSTVGHPERVWFFGGLNRVAYRFSLDEIDGSDNVVNNLALFFFVPGELAGSLVRDDEQIQVGYTSGFDEGATSFTFDGTDGKPNYIGWNIVPSEIGGRGILVRGVDYSWDKVTGTLSLLIADDKFYDEAWFNIHFDPIIADVAQDSGSTILSILVTNNYTMTAADIGKSVIVEPAVNYLEIAMPDISLAVEGKRTTVSVGDMNFECCTKLVPFAVGQKIRFLSGNLYLLRNESISFYKFNNGGTYEWRVLDAFGNFTKVGQTFFSDIQVPGSVLLDGSLVDVNAYARLYNEFVDKLPVSQVDSYTDHPHQAYRFSKVDTGTSQFYLADRRDMSVKAAKGGATPFTPSKFDQGQVGQFTSIIVYPTGDSFLKHAYPPTGLGKGLRSNAPEDLAAYVTLNVGKINKVDSILLNPYIFI